VLRVLFAAAFTATTVIPVVCEDVVLAWLVEFVEEVVHLKIKLEVFTALEITFAEGVDVEVGLKERAAEEGTSAVSQIALNALAGERMLVQVLVCGCDDIFFKVGTLKWVAGLPHVKLAIGFF
jgi:hypothetical protein